MLFPGILRAKNHGVGILVPANGCISLKRERLHCPICQSSDIFWVVGGYLGNLYRCKRCGYQGSLILEYEDDSDA
jgi:hypothetical protein